MLRIWTKRTCCSALLVFALVVMTWAQEEERPQGPPDPDIWTLSVLSELTPPGIAYPKETVPYWVGRQTGQEPPLEQYEKGAFVDDEGIYHRGLIKRGRRRERILASVQGPGVLTRLWIGRQSGNFRVYMDGGAAPVIDMPCDTIFGHHQRFFSGQLGARLGSSVILSLPLAFKESVVVTLDGPSTSYEVQYRQFAKDVEVESFAADRGVETIYRAPHIIAGLDQLTESPKPLTAKAGQALVVPRPHFDASIGSGQEVTVFEFATSTAKVLATITLDLLKPFRQFHRLEDLELKVNCDGLNSFSLPMNLLFGTDSVFVPGSTLAVQTYQALPAMRRWQFRLPMPFAKSLRVSVRNNAGSPVRGLRLSFGVRDARPEEERWRLGSTFVKGSSANMGSLELAIKGKGFLVGEMIMSRSDFSSGEVQVEVSSQSKSALSPASLRIHFAHPGGEGSPVATSLWGGWHLGPDKGFSANRYRALDRFPFSDLNWSLKAQPETNLGAICAGVLYYQPREKTGALSSGADR